MSALVVKDEDLCENAYRLGKILRDELRKIETDMITTVRERFA